MPKSSANKPDSSSATPASSAAAAPAAPTPAGPVAPAAGSPSGAVMFVDLPAAQFQAIVAQLTTLLGQIQAAIVNPTVLTADERKHSGGRLKDGEAAVLLKVLDVARRYPTSFESLANMDEGVDPNTFEVDLVANRLQNAGALLPVVHMLQALETTMSDCMLDLNEKAHPPASEAYALAKVLARSTPAIASMIAPVKTFYSNIAAAAAATRKANAAAAAAAAATKAAASATGPTGPAKT